MKNETWKCDFCKKSGLTISSTGTIYCRLCKRSYHQTIYDLARKLIKEERNGQGKAV